MTRTVLIYLAVLTAAEFSTAHKAGAQDEAQANTRLEAAVVVEQMKPVHADGKGIAPEIMDFTKDPEADKSAGEFKKLVSPKKSSTAKRFASYR